MFSFGEVGSQGPGSFVTRMSATNTQGSPIENFMFQAAVPKVSESSNVLFLCFCEKWPLYYSGHYTIKG